MLLKFIAATKSPETEHVLMHMHIGTILGKVYRVSTSLTNPPWIPLKRSVALDNPQTLFLHCYPVFSPL